MVLSDEFTYCMTGALGVGGIDGDEIEVRIQVGQVGLGVFHDDPKDIPLLLKVTGQVLDTPAPIAHLGKQPLALPLGDKGMQRFAYVLGYLLQEVDFLFGYPAFTFIGQVNQA